MGPRLLYKLSAVFSLPMTTWFGARGQVKIILLPPGLPDGLDCASKLSSPSRRSLIDDCSTPDLRKVEIWLDCSIGLVPMTKISMYCNRRQLQRMRHVPLEVTTQRSAVAQTDFLCRTVALQ